MAPHARQRLLLESDGSMEELRKRYAGWSAAAITQELELLAVEAGSIVVPRDVDSIPPAVALACSSADNLLVSPGDYEWSERVMVGADQDSVRLRVALCPPALPGRMQHQGGGEEEEEKETRLWGQWALASNSWGSFANVSCLFHAVPRGGRALMLVTGGSAPFPWLFHSVNVRPSSVATCRLVVL
jgi:hypothetical protein